MKKINWKKIISFGLHLIKWFFIFIFSILILTNFNIWSFILFSIFLFLINKKSEKYTKSIINKVGKKVFYLLTISTFIFSMSLLDIENTNEKQQNSNTKIDEKTKDQIDENIKNNISHQINSQIQEKKELEKNKNKEKENLEKETEIKKQEKTQNQKNILSKKESNQKKSKIKPKIIKKENDNKKTNEVKNDLVEVVKIVDGDTIKVLINNKIETIRIIGINTPEIGSRLECFGNEAKKEAIKLLQNHKVKIINDETQHLRDKYYRLLGYVLIDGKIDFGSEMIKNGFAYEYTYNKPYKNQLLYKKLEKYARENKKGLWAKNACISTKTQDNKESIKTTNKSGTNDQKTSLTRVWKGKDGNCLIKGNISRNSKEKIYHLPGQQAYKKTQINPSEGERFFCTEQEAINAGWRKAKR